LTQFPTVPKGRVILDGTGNAQNVSDVGSDSRLKECLLAVHDYSFFGSESMTSESDWVNHIKGEVGSYADRTICTEWGGPMSPGSKNGKSYDYLDYSQSPTNYFEAYIRGISNQLRSWNMGSFYWPGLRDGDWYSMMIKSGSGANITLSIPNKSGLERLQYAWGPTPAGTDGGAGGSAGGRSGADGGLGGNVADGAAGSTGGRPDAAGVDGPGDGRGGNGGEAGNAGAAGTSAGGTGGAAGGQGGSAAGGTTQRSSSVTAAGGGASANSGSAGGSGGTTTAAAGGTTANGSSESSGAGAKGSAGQSPAGSSGTHQPSSNSNGQTSGCSCRLGRDARDGSTGWVFLLGFLVIAAIRNWHREWRADPSSS
jgi:hypothetical protein